MLQAQQQQDDLLKHVNTQTPSTALNYVYADAGPDAVRALV